MDLSRGELKKARLVNLNNENKFVECMFNPHEYTLTKSNSWKKEAKKGKDVGEVNFAGGGSQILKLTLYFDTLMTNGDVREHTDKLWEMMMVDKNKKLDKSGKSSPPEVAFHWGRLYFRAVITNMTQKFTLFKPDGTPVRCTVNITLEQHVDVNDYKKGDASTVVAPAVEKIKEEVSAKLNDRIDNIIADTSGLDEVGNTLRDVLDANNIDDPLNIVPGSKLKL